MENQSDIQNHLVEIQADDHDLLVNFDNENDDMLGYESEKYYDADDMAETNHSDQKLVKRGITRLYKFHKEYGKPGGIKIKVTFDALNRVSGLHRALFLSFLGDLVGEHIGLKILSWKKVDKESRDKLWDELTLCLVRKRRLCKRSGKWIYIQEVTPMAINNIDSSAYEAFKCKLWHLKKSNLVALGTIYKSDGKQMLHNQSLPNDCYKVSIYSSLVDATCIPNVENNGLKTVKDGVGGFFTWLKNQAVLDGEDYKNLKAMILATQQWNSFALKVGKYQSAGGTHQLSSGNSFSLTVAECSSSGIFITSNRNDLEHFIPNNPPLNLMLHLQSSFLN
nr:hypothetical protein [Tanacetum cinerariifolium]